MVAIDSTPYGLTASRTESQVRDVVEVVLGFGFMMLVLWVPTREQLVLGPITLFSMLALVLVRRPSLNQLGLGWRGLLRSLWTLPVAAALAAVSTALARKAGILHPLTDPNLSHVGGYLIWTTYQQFLLQDYFMPRLLRLLRNQQAAITVTAVLFSVAHLPNLALAAATVVWGAVSTALFLRYRSLYVLGIVQALLGLSFAVCVPDVFVRHMRVGLGYLHYRG